MKTLTRNINSAVCVFLLSLLPAIVNGDSLADKKLDTPVETWNNQGMEVERALLMMEASPTAAGPASAEQQQSTMMHESKDDEMGNMKHETKKYKNAYHYKREVFGSN